MHVYEKNHVTERFSRFSNCETVKFVYIVV